MYIYYIVLSISFYVVLCHFTWYYTCFIFYYTILCSFKHLKIYQNPLLPCFNAKPSINQSTTVKKFKSLPGQYENPWRPVWSQRCSLVHDVDIRSHGRFQFHHRWYPTVGNLLISFAAHCLGKGIPNKIRKRCQNWGFRDVIQSNAIFLSIAIPLQS